MLPFSACNRESADSKVALAEALRMGGYQTVGIFTNPHHHSSSGYWEGFDVARYLPAKKGDVAHARGPQIHREFFDWYGAERDDRSNFACLESRRDLCRGDPSS